MTTIAKRIISLVTLACFVMTQSISANPGGAGIDIVRAQETPSFLQIDIPVELATLDGLFEAPARPDPRLILHIQNAHANFGAQQKIKQLLQYLEKTYAFKTIFVEGASEDLNPDYLKIFPDRERNMKLANFLAEQGELTGAELFILEQDGGWRMEDGGKPNTQDGGWRMADGGKPGIAPSAIHPPPSVRAHGIERAELYRENYEALKKVFGAEATVNRYLGGFESRLDGLASKVFTPELRKLLGEWRKFEKGHREFMPYIKNLSGEAKRILGIDLASLFAQVQWPQLTRILVLQNLEAELNTEKGLEERDAAVRFLKEKRVSESLIRAIENFQDQRVSVMRAGPGEPVAAPQAKSVIPEDVNRGSSSGEAAKGLDSRQKHSGMTNGKMMSLATLQPRDLMEQLVTEAGPKGFRFSDYPNFSLYAGYLILKSELDPKGLFDEIKILFAQVLDKLAETGDSSSQNMSFPRKRESRNGSPIETLGDDSNKAREQGVGSVNLQKQLLELYRDEELVRKLLNLELTRKNWQEVLARKDLLEPGVLVGRLKELQSDGGRRMEDGAKHKTKGLTPSAIHHPSSVSASKNEKFRAEVVQVQTAAYAFYEAARKREEVFYGKISSVMAKTGDRKAVLITGGFHTDGITELLREHEVSYGILTPRLSEKSDEHLYRSVMLQNRQTVFELSYLDAASRLIDWAARVKQIGEDEAVAGIKAVLLGIGAAGEFTTIPEAIEIFNASKAAVSAGIAISAKSVSKKNGKPVYQVQFKHSGVTIPAATTAKYRDELKSIAKNITPPAALLRSPAIKAAAGEIYRTGEAMTKVEVGDNLGAPNLRTLVKELSNKTKTQTTFTPGQVAAAVLAEVDRLSKGRSENRQPADRSEARVAKESRKEALRLLEAMAGMTLRGRNGKTYELKRLADPRMGFEARNEKGQPLIFSLTSRDEAWLEENKLNAGNNPMIEVGAVLPEEDQDQGLWTAFLSHVAQNLKGPTTVMIQIYNFPTLLEMAKKIAKEVKPSDEVKLVLKTGKTMALRNSPWMGYRDVPNRVLIGLPNAVRDALHARDLLNGFVCDYLEANSDGAMIQELLKTSRVQTLPKVFGKGKLTLQVTAFADLDGREYKDVAVLFTPRIVARAEIRDRNPTPGVGLVDPNVVSRTFGNNPVEDVRRAWFAKLRDSQLPMIGASAAPINYDPAIMKSRTFGPMRVITMPTHAQDLISVPQGQDDELGGRPLFVAENNPKVLFNEDLFDPGYFILAVPNPKCNFDCLIVLREWLKQRLTGRAIRVMIGWARKGAVTEFHHSDHNVPHQHMHLYAPETVPIMNYAGSFVAEEEAGGVTTGKIGYPVQHIALRSQDPEALQKALLSYSDALEAQGQWFKMTVIPDANGRDTIAVIVLFKKVSQLEKFQQGAPWIDFVPVGFIKTFVRNDDKDQTRSIAVDKDLPVLFPGLFLDPKEFAAMRQTLWSDWKKSAPPSVRIEKQNEQVAIHTGTRIPEEARGETPASQGSLAAVNKPEAGPVDALRTEGKRIFDTFYLQGEFVKQKPLIEYPDPKDRPRIYSKVLICRNENVDFSAVIDYTQTPPRIVDVEALPRERAAWEEGVSSKRSDVRAETRADQGRADAATLESREKQDVKLKWWSSWTAILALMVSQAFVFLAAAYVPSLSGVIQGLDAYSNGTMGVIAISTTLTSVFLEFGLLAVLVSKHHPGSRVKSTYEAPETLKETGPYKYFRHPMNTLVTALSWTITLCVAAAGVRGSWLHAYVAASTIVTALTAAMIFNEEKELRRKFANYPEYSKSRLGVLLLPLSWEEAIRGAPAKMANFWSRGVRRVLTESQNRLERGKRALGTAIAQGRLLTLHGFLGVSMELGLAFNGTSPWRVPGEKLAKVMLPFWYITTQWVVLGLFYAELPGVVTSVISAIYAGYLFLFHGGWFRGALRAPATSVPVAVPEKEASSEVSRADTRATLEVEEPAKPGEVAEKDSGIREDQPAGSEGFRYAPFENVPQGWGSRVPMAQQLSTIAKWAFVPGRLGAMEPQGKYGRDPIQDAISVTSFDDWMSAVARQFGLEGEADQSLSLANIVVGSVVLIALGISAYYDPFNVYLVIMGIPSLLLMIASVISFITARINSGTRLISAKIYSHPLLFAAQLYGNVKRAFRASYRNLRIGRSVESRTSSLIGNALLGIIIGRFRGDAFFPVVMHEFVGHGLMDTEEIGAHAFASWAVAEQAIHEGKETWEKIGPLIHPAPYYSPYVRKGYQDVMNQTIAGFRVDPLIDIGDLSLPPAMARRLGVFADVQKIAESPTYQALPFVRVSAIVVGLFELARKRGYSKDEAISLVWEYVRGIARVNDGNEEKKVRAAILKKMEDRSSSAMGTQTSVPVAVPEKESKSAVARAETLHPQLKEEEGGPNRSEARAPERAVTRSAWSETVRFFKRLAGRDHPPSLEVRRTAGEYFLTADEEAFNGSADSTRGWSSPLISLQVGRHVDLRVKIAGNSGQLHHRKTVSEIRNRIATMKRARALSREALEVLADIEDGIGNVHILSGAGILFYGRAGRLCINERFFNSPRAFESLVYFISNQRHSRRRADSIYLELAGGRTPLTVMEGMIQRLKIRGSRYDVTRERRLEAIRAEAEKAKREDRLYVFSASDVPELFAYLASGSFLPAGIAAKLLRQADEHPDWNYSRHWEEIERTEAPSIEDNEGTRELMSRVSTDQLIEGLKSVLVAEDPELLALLEEMIREEKLSFFYATDTTSPGTYDGETIELNMFHSSPDVALRQLLELHRERKTGGARNVEKENEAYFPVDDIGLTESEASGDYLQGLLLYGSMGLVIAGFMAIVASLFGSMVASIDVPKTIGEVNELGQSIRDAAQDAHSDLAGMYHQNFVAPLEVAESAMNAEAESIIGTLSQNGETNVTASLERLLADNDDLRIRLLMEAEDVRLDRLSPEAKKLLKIAAQIEQAEQGVRQEKEKKSKAERTVEPSRGFWRDVVEAIKDATSDRGPDVPTAQSQPDAIGQTNLVNAAGMTNAVTGLSGQSSNSAPVTALSGAGMTNNMPFTNAVTGLSVQSSNSAPVTADSGAGMTNNAPFTNTLSGLSPVSSNAAPVVDISGAGTMNKVLFTNAVPDLSPVSSNTAPVIDISGAGRTNALPRGTASTNGIPAVNGQVGPTNGIANLNDTNSMTIPGMNNSDMIPTGTNGISLTGTNAWSRGTLPKKTPPQIPQQAEETIGQEDAAETGGAFDGQPLEDDIAEIQVVPAPKNIGDLVVGKQSPVRSPIFNKKSFRPATMEGAAPSRERGASDEEITPGGTNRIQVVVDPKTKKASVMILQDEYVAELSGNLTEGEMLITDVFPAMQNGAFVQKGSVRFIPQGQLTDEKMTVKVTVQPMTAGQEMQLPWLLNGRVVATEFKELGLKLSADGVLTATRTIRGAVKIRYTIQKMTKNARLEVSGIDSAEWVAKEEAALPAEIKAMLDKDNTWTASDEVFAETMVKIFNTYFAYQADLMPVALNVEAGELELWMAMLEKAMRNAEFGGRLLCDCDVLNTYMFLLYAMRAKRLGQKVPAAFIAGYSNYPALERLSVGEAHGNFIVNMDGEAVIVDATRFVPIVYAGRLIFTGSESSEEVSRKIIKLQEEMKLDDKTAKLFEDILNKAKERESTKKTGKTLPSSHAAKTFDPPKGLIKTFDLPGSRNGNGSGSGEAGASSFDFSFKFDSPEALERALSRAMADTPKSGFELTRERANANVRKEAPAEQTTWKPVDSITNFPALPALHELSDEEIKAMTPEQLMRSWNERKDNDEYFNRGRIERRLLEIARQASPADPDLPAILGFLKDRALSLGSANEVLAGIAKFFIARDGVPEATSGNARWIYTLANIYNSYVISGNAASSDENDFATLQSLEDQLVKTGMAGVKAITQYDSVGGYDIYLLGKFTDHPEAVRWLVKNAEKNRFGEKYEGDRLNEVVIADLPAVQAVYDEFLLFKKSLVSAKSEDQPALVRDYLNALQSKVQKMPAEQRAGFEWLAGRSLAEIEFDMSDADWSGHEGFYRHYLDGRIALRGANYIWLMEIDRVVDVSYLLSVVNPSNKQILDRYQTAAIDRLFELTVTAAPQIRERVFKDLEEKLFKRGDYAVRARIALHFEDHYQAKAYRDKRSGLSTDTAGKAAEMAELAVALRLLDGIFRFSKSDPEIFDGVVRKIVKNVKPPVLANALRMALRDKILPGIAVLKLADVAAAASLDEKDRASVQDSIREIILNYYRQYTFKSEDKPVFDDFIKRHAAPALTPDIAPLEEAQSKAARSENRVDMIPSVTNAATWEQVRGDYVKRIGDMAGSIKGLPEKYSNLKAGFLKTQHRNTRWHNEGPLLEDHLAAILRALDLVTGMSSDQRDVRIPPEAIAYIQQWAARNPWLLEVFILLHDIGKQDTVEAKKDLAREGYRFRHHEFVSFKISQSKKITYEKRSLSGIPWLPIVIKYHDLGYSAQQRQDFQNFYAELQAAGITEPEKVREAVEFLIAVSTLDTMGSYTDAAGSFPGMQGILNLIGLLREYTEVELSPFAEKLDPAADANTERFWAGLSRKAQAAFKTALMSDFLRAVAAFRMRVGHRIFDEAIQEKEVLIAGLQSLAFFISPEFINLVVRRYFPFSAVAIDLQGVPGKETLKPLSWNYAAQPGSSRALTQERAREMMAKAVVAVTAGFYQGKVRVEEIRIGRLQRLFLKLHNGFSAVILSHLLKKALVTAVMGGVAYMLSRYLNIASVVRNVILDFVITILAARIIGSVVAAWQAVERNWELRFYQNALSRFSRGMTPQEVADNEAKFRSDFDVIRGQYLGPKSTLSAGEQGLVSDLLARTQRFVWEGLQRGDRYGLVVPEGVRLATLTGISADARSVILGMLAEIANHNPEYFQKLKAEWAPNTVRNWTSFFMRRPFSEPVARTLLELSRVAEWEARDPQLKAMARAEVAKLHPGQELGIPQIDAEAEILLKEKPEFFDRAFEDSLFKHLSDLKGADMDLKRWGVESYYGALVSRLERVRENLTAGRPVNNEYRDEIVRRAALWLADLENIKEDPASFGMEPAAVERMIKNLTFLYDLRDITRSRQGLARSENREVQTARSDVRAVTADDVMSILYPSRRPTFPMRAQWTAAFRGQIRDTFTELRDLQWTYDSSEKEQKKLMAEIASRINRGKINKEVLRYFKCGAEWDNKGGRTYVISLVGDPAVATQLLSEQKKFTDISHDDPGTSPGFQRTIEDVKDAKAAVLLIGGADGNRGADDGVTVLKALASAQRKTRLVILDAGTEVGVWPVEAGKVRADQLIQEGDSFHLVGVGLQRHFRPDRETINRSNGPARERLFFEEMNHSHLLGVTDKGTKGRRQHASDVLLKLTDEVSRGKPSVAILQGGGAVTLYEMEQCLKAGRRVFVMQDTGRAADVIAYVMANPQALRDPKTYRKRLAMDTTLLLGAEGLDLFDEVVRIFGKNPGYERLVTSVEGRQGEKVWGELLSTAITRSENREEGTIPVTAQTPAALIAQASDLTATNWKDILDYLIRATEESIRRREPLPLTHLYVDIDNTLVTPRGYENTEMQKERMIRLLTRKYGNASLARTFTYGKYGAEEPRLIRHGFYQTAGGLDPERLRDLRKLGVKVIAVTARNNTERMQKTVLGFFEVVKIRIRQALDRMLFTSVVDKTLFADGTGDAKVKLMRQDLADDGVLEADYKRVALVDDYKKNTGPVRYGMGISTFLLSPENPNRENLSRQNFIDLAEQSQSSGLVFEYLMNAYQQSVSDEEAQEVVLRAMMKLTEESDRTEFNECIVALNKFMADHGLTLKDFNRPTQDDDLERSFFGLKMNKLNTRVIAIDGLSATLKSETASALARRLGFLHVDSGAFYRTMGAQMLEWIKANTGIDLNNDAELRAFLNGNEAVVADFVKNNPLSYRLQNGEVIVSIGGKEFGEGMLRSSGVTIATPLLAQYYSVNKSIMQLIRKIGEENNSVVEGRTIGTMVFPDASIKLYLEAAMDARARRRLAEYLRIKDKNISTLEQVVEQLKKRDHSDMYRSIAALAVPEGPGVERVNTSKLTEEEAAAKIQALFEAAQAKSPLAGEIGSRLEARTAIDRASEVSGVDLRGLIEDILNNVDEVRKGQGKAALTDKERKKIRQFAELVAQAHKNQTRKGDARPYFVHPLEVVRRAVMEYGATSVLGIIIYFLHDAREDQEDSYELLKMGRQQLIDQIEEYSRQAAGDEQIEFNNVRLGVALLSKIESKEIRSGVWQISYKDKTGKDIEEIFSSDNYSDPKAAADDQAQIAYLDRLVNPHLYYHKETGLLTAEEAAKRWRYSPFDDEFIRAVQQGKLADRNSNLDDLLSLYSGNADLIDEKLKGLAAKTFRKTLRFFIPYFLEAQNAGNSVNPEDRRKFYVGMIASLVRYATLDTETEYLYAKPLKNAAIQALRDLKSDPQLAKYRILETYATPEMRTALAAMSLVATAEVARAAAGVETSVTRSENRDGEPAVADPAAFEANLERIAKNPFKFMARDFNAEKLAEKMRALSEVKGESAKVLRIDIPKWAKLAADQMKRGKRGESVVLRISGEVSAIYEKVIKLKGVFKKPSVVRGLDVMVFNGKKEIDSVQSDPGSLVWNTLAEAKFHGDFMDLIDQVGGGNRRRLSHLQASVQAPELSDIRNYEYFAENDKHFRDESEGGFMGQGVLAYLENSRNPYKELVVTEKGFSITLRLQDLPGFLFNTKVLKVLQREYAMHNKPVPTNWYLMRNEMQRWVNEKMAQLQPGEHCDFIIAVSNGNPRDVAALRKYLPRAEVSAAKPEEKRAEAKTVELVEQQLPEFLKKYEASYLFIGHGKNNQYKDPAAVERYVATIVKEMDRRWGKGNWLAIYGGDPADVNNPDLGYAMQMMKRNHGVPLLAVKSESDRKAPGAEVADFVYYYPTELSPNKKPIRGGIWFGKPKGGTQVYLSDFFLKNGLRGVYAMGGGQTALEEFQYAQVLARDNDLETHYEPFETRNRPGEFGALHQWFVKQQVRATSVPEVAAGQKTLPLHEMQTQIGFLFAEFTDPKTKNEKIEDYIEEVTRSIETAAGERRDIFILGLRGARAKGLNAAVRNRLQKSGALSPSAKQQYFKWIQLAREDAGSVNASLIREIEITAGDLVARKTEARAEVRVTDETLLRDLPMSVQSEISGILGEAKNDPVTKSLVQRSISLLFGTWLAPGVTVGRLKSVGLPDIYAARIEKILLQDTSAKSRSELRVTLTPEVRSAGAVIPLGLDPRDLARAEAQGISATGIVAILAGKIFDLKIGAVRLTTALTELVTFRKKTSGVDVSGDFRKSYSGSILPAGELHGFAVDILEGSPSADKWDAVEAVLRLNKNQHYGFILLGKPDALFWARFRALPLDIQKRLHVKSVAGASSAIVLKNSLQKMFGEAQKAGTLRGATFVVTGLPEVLKGLADQGTIPAAFVDWTPDIPSNLRDGAGTAMAAVRSQELVLGGEKFSERTNSAIKPNGNRFVFVLKGLQAIAANLSREIQGALSIQRAA
jgi:CMP/dCMP kinase